MIASIVAALIGGRLLAWPTTARLRRHLAQARRALFHDPLTGLLNRTGFTHAYTAGQHRRQRLTVIVLDLDRFKAVNDTHGHDIGDQLLIAAADRIRSAAQWHGGVAARLSGDEFAVALPVRLGLHRVVERILAVVAIPVTATITDDTTAPHPTVRLTVTASAGIYTTLPDDDLDLALRRADIAMHHAKRSGGDVPVPYQTGMHLPPATDRRGRHLQDRHDGRVLP
jgi:diguanylate cyclase (GGDEF)-like protein